MNEHRKYMERLLARLLKARHYFAVSPLSSPHLLCLVIPEVIVLVRAAVNQLCCQTGCIWSQSVSDPSLVSSHVLAAEPG